MDNTPQPTQQIDTDDECRRKAEAWAKIARMGQDVGNDVTICVTKGGRLVPWQRRKAA